MKYTVYHCGYRIATATSLANAFEEADNHYGNTLDFSEIRLIRSQYFNIEKDPAWVSLDHNDDGLLYIQYEINRDRE